MTESGIAVTLRELVALRRGALAGVWSHRPGSGIRPGSHAGFRRSRGMEFAEVRPYQPGDDVRTVDWRQTARRGRPYTKLFQEEHERPVCLLVDLGPGMRFGTRVAFKSVVAARTAAWLAWTAVASGDRVGGVVWNGGEAREIPPQGRDLGALNLLRRLAEVSAAPPAGTEANLATPLRTLARRLRPGSRVALVSDFAGFDAETECLVLALAKGAELLLVHIYDAFEAEAPPGCYPITDGCRRRILDLRSDAARAAHSAAFAARRTALETLARRAGASLTALATHAELPAGLSPALAGRPAP